MTIEKTTAYVLKTLPYRESSGIFYLLTENHGLIHGIAKGIRKKKTSASFLERGFLIETLLYIKPQRDLCVLGDIRILKFFPKTRVDLFGNAVRDAMFEMVLATVSVGHPYPELFHVLARFLCFLEDHDGFCQKPLLLWKFYQEFACIMGFGFNLEKCFICQQAMSDVNGGYLVIEKGGIACERCAQRKDTGYFIQKQAIEYLSSIGSLLHLKEAPRFSLLDVRRLTHLFASYCQYHCDARFEHKALAFLDSLLTIDVSGVQTFSGE
jgi:DNA repair protein RecO (recombination protein O)